MGAKHFGARVARLEDPVLLTGRGRFVDDIKLPGMLHACFVRSPHAHARIASIDVAAARAMPGVHAVLTADDLPPRMATGQIPMLVPNPCDQDAAHAACARAQTRSAMSARPSRWWSPTTAISPRTPPRRLTIDFDVLAAVSDCRDAAKPDAPRAHSDLASNIAAFVPMSYGDLDAAFADAAHVFEEEMFLHRGGAMTLEGRAVLASYDAAATC